MAKTFPIHPAHPERTCWGCDNYCAADSMTCGNGSERTQHPMELFGDDWAETGLDPYLKPAMQDSPAAEPVSSGQSAPAIKSEASPRTVPV